MALVAVNAPRGREQREGTLAKIMLATKIAEGVLGIGLAIPKFMQDKKIAQAQTEKTQAETDLVRGEAGPADPGVLKYLEERGYPTTGIRTKAQADEAVKKTYETPGQKSSREKTDLMLELLAAKEGRERTQESRDAEKFKRETEMPVLTPAELEVDKKFAADYNEFAAGGGYAQAQKNLKQARWAIQKLLSAQKEGKNYSGKDVGLLEGKAKSMVSPDAVAMEENVQQIVTTNLRQALGAQFTEKEGTRIMNQTFNPMLDEKENARRLENLIDQLDQQIKAKEEAGKYFQKNRTLKGWSGTFINPSSVGGEGETKIIGGKRYRKIKGGWEEVQ